MSDQARTARRLAASSLVCLGACVLAIVISEWFLWGRPTLFAYENVMETGAVFLAISAGLGIASFVRAGESGAARPALVKWTFSLSTLSVALLTWLLATLLGMPPST